MLCYCWRVITEQTDETARGAVPCTTAHLGPQGWKRDGGDFRMPPEAQKCFAAPAEAFRVGETSVEHVRKAGLPSCFEALEMTVGLWSQQCSWGRAEALETTVRLLR